jgi:hypothetical protein
VWVADANTKWKFSTRYEVGDYPNAVVGDINPNLSLTPNGEPMSKPDLWFASWICVELEDGLLSF